jgi:ABC-type spermidine/putrescine transport system permease subunit II
MKRLLILPLLLLCTIAFAAVDLNITWNAVPASYSNQLYRVYISTNNGPFLLAWTSTATNVIIPNVPGGLYCASITASNVWGEQPVKSIPGCALGPVTVPPVVTNVNVLLQNSP